MKKIFIWIVVVVLLVIAGWWFFLRVDHYTIEEQTGQITNPPPPANSNNNTSSDSEADSSSDASDTPDTSDISDSDNTWIGTLHISDDASKGNLMLNLDDSDTVVYIRTSRDFSALIGKDVNVTYEGTLENFKLVDIVAK
jgi:cytoskeletal protein RodZ